MLGARGQLAPRNATIHYNRGNALERHRPDGQTQSRPTTRRSCLQPVAICKRTPIAALPCAISTILPARPPRLRPRWRTIRNTSMRAIISPTAIAIPDSLPTRSGKSASFLNSSPKHAKAHNALGNILADQGRPGRGRNGVRGRDGLRSPDGWRPQATGSAPSNIYRASPKRRSPRRTGNGMSVTPRKLRRGGRSCQRRATRIGALVIGFVSPDFGQHPVGVMTVRLFENLDRSAASADRLQHAARRTRGRHQRAHPRRHRLAARGWLGRRSPGPARSATRKSTS